MHLTPASVSTGLTMLTKTTSVRLSHMASRAVRPTVPARCLSATIKIPARQQCLFSTAPPKHPLLLTIRCRAPRPPQQALRLPKSASRPSSTAAAESSAGAPPPSPDEPLTWNRFLALRKTRRRIGLGSSIVSAVVCLVSGIAVLQSQDIEYYGAQMFGLDPIVVLGMATVACGGIGWLIGPFFGNAVFNLMYRRLRTQITLKETQFFHRIKKRRVDPTSSSLSNPVPDYYGEKIGSVGDYRRWLKDQRAFNLKRDRTL